MDPMPLVQNSNTGVRVTGKAWRCHNLWYALHCWTGLAFVLEFSLLRDLTSDGYQSSSCFLFPFSVFHFHCFRFPFPLFPFPFSVLLLLKPFIFFHKIYSNWPPKSKFLSRAMFFLLQPSILSVHKPSILTFIIAFNIKHGTRTNPSILNVTWRLGRYD